MTDHSNLPVKVIDGETADWLRSKTTSDLIEIGAKLNQIARRIVADETRRRKPDWDDEQVAKVVVRRFLVDENLPMLYASDYRETGELD
jgi:hypothetical protein